MNVADERDAYEVFELGDLTLQTGRTLRNAKLAYKYVATQRHHKFTW